MNLYENGLVIDMFAGGGGASEGIENGLGRPIDIAVNHCDEAIAMHEINHSDTKHYTEDVWEVDPIKSTGGKPILLMWLSPSCTHHSKARGGRPTCKQLRGQAWLAVRWAKAKRPAIIMLENVEEFITWGPIDKNGIPIKKLRGETFNEWVNALEDIGYKVDYRELKACDYGAGTTRKRLFVIARCDGLPIIWPKPTHGEDKGLLPYLSAGECIDWSIKPKSILGRKRMLATNTLKRIVKGGIRFALGENNPFITRIGQTGWGGVKMSYDINSPLTTIVSKNEHLLVTAYTNKWNVPANVAPTNSNKELSVSHILKMRNTNYGDSMHNPLPTVTAGGLHYGEVRTFILKYYGTGEGHSIDEPIHTITAKDRFAKIDYEIRSKEVSITDEQRLNAWWIARLFEENGGGITYPVYPSPRIQAVGNEVGVIVDIAMRMLEPRELFTCQGFDQNYVIEIDANGKKFTKKTQVKLVGNSVSPLVAQALVESNIVEMYEQRMVG